MSSIEDPRKVDKEVETLTVNKTSHCPTDFDLEKLCTAFGSCLDEDGKILLSFYIEGYDELYKFLNLLGTVFGWVSSDVEAKLKVLRSHRKESATSQHYDDARSMLSFEVASKLIKPKCKDSTTGARNLLRLHRALDFIVAFLRDVQKLEPDDKCCPAAQRAYKMTLEKFHPWIVQKTANLAMHMLPTKNGMIDKISHGDETKIKRVHELLPDAVASMTAVYDSTEALYREFDLLNLP